MGIQANIWRFDVSGLHETRRGTALNATSAQSCRFTWAHRYTGHECCRFEFIWGTRGEGIRQESYTRMNLTGPLPLHTLVTEEAARLWFAQRQDSYFISEPTPASVKLKFKLD